MTHNEGARAATAPNVAVGGVTAAEKGSGTQGHHLKKSPTLLFDLLAEPSKEKQNQKLQRATLGPQDLAGQLATQSQPQSRVQQQSPSPQQHTAPHSQQQQQLHPQPTKPMPVPHPASQASSDPTQPVVQQQQSQLPNGSQDRTSNRLLGPETPDLRLGRNGSASVGAASGVATLSETSSGGCGTTWSASSGYPRVSDTAVSARVTAGSEGTQRGGKNEFLYQQHQRQEEDNGQQQQQQQKQPDGNGGQPGVEADKQAPGDAAAGDVGAGGGSGGGGHLAAAAAGQAAAPAPGPPVDLLSVFTPRMILQELLGELFIPPERLTKQGTFGQGAFATVQSCSLEDPGGGPNLLVAVKALKPEVLSDLDDLRRFLLEANLLRKLRHPNIVSIHGLGAHRLDSLEELRGSAYVVMEALEGGDLRMMVLRQMTGRSAAYSRLDALRWCLHIAAACAYLHETCRPMVIHRDLKLENVMLSGGPTDNRVAKITDFGLHKRARYSRTEDVLIAVTNEWSTHGGSVYRRSGAVPPGGGGVPRQQDPSRDASAYGGSVIDASYYGGNMFYDGGLLSGPSVHRNGDSSHYHNRSASSRYVALAAAGMAAAAATGSNAPSAGPAAPGPLNGTTTNGLHGSSARNAGGSNHEFVDAIGQGGGADRSYGGASAAVSVGRASSTGPGDSLRAGSEAAAELGITGGGGTGKVTERERPYLLAYDKRYDTVQASSKFNSTNDLVAMHEAAVTAAAAAATTLTSGAAAAGAGSGAAGATTKSPFASQAAQAPAPVLQAGEIASGPAPLAAGAGPLRNSSQPLGWIPPNVVPPSLEESVHRKMLALMALESAAAAASAGAAPITAGTAGPATGPVGAAASGTAAPAAAAGDDSKESFSVTEFVRAASALPVDGVGPTGPSAVMLMRGLSMALQQQRQEEQQQHQHRQSSSGGGAAPEPAARQPSPNTGLPSPTVPSPSPSPSLAFPGAGLGLGSGAPPPRAPRTASTAMKTVPEHNRMSMDLGTASVAGSRGNNGGYQAPPPAGNRPGSRAQAGGGSASDGSVGGRRAAASRREKVEAAVARMADATRQVGSLVYMAPELVLSGNYNEKVDVFSFAIMAYELFSGKLLAMKIAHDFAYQQMQSSKGPHAAMAPAGGGGGGGAGLGASSPVPLGGTRSAEEDAEAGVMAYVMRRSTAGAREALPSWWPSELRSLIARCWAQDPAERPSFSQIHRELRRMQASGCLKEMDSRDPLRNMGCGCCIS